MPAAHPNARRAWSVAATASGRMGMRDGRKAPGSTNVGEGPLRQASESFVVQRLNGVDARCAAGREPGGCRGCEGQYQGECCESGRIE